MESPSPLLASDSLRILTLGDGDFSFSLDLARHLSGLSVGTIELIATGIDSKEELVGKYKDVNFILNGIRETQSPHLSPSIKHGVNAIVNEFDSGATIASQRDAVDHVIFHHPHLGTENAELHGRFLCHFFHSCVNFWMKPNGGLLHLTLVDGQFDRWQCAKAAEKHGLCLLSRGTFVPPPVSSPAYHYRRHQTGKSFESRRPSGSETFVYGRLCDKGQYAPREVLTWTVKASTDIPSNPSNPSTLPPPATKPEVNLLSCPHCDKTFREERSRKCHIRAKHPDGANKRVKVDVDDAFACSKCQNEKGEPRTFLSAQALQDHVRAKHSGLHANILPDWHQTSATATTEVATVSSESSYGSCPICNLKFLNEEHKKAHSFEFIPTTAKSLFDCSFCDKRFREKRAKLQHENFCTKRLS